MARDHARLSVHIWDDEDFVQLSAVAKLLYLQLVSQPKLAYSGVLDLAARRWARSHPDLDLAAVRSALAELDAGRFLAVDQETEEVLVRSFIRRDELWKQPNVLRSALRSAFTIVSPILRGALARELRRLPVEVTGPAPMVAARELEAGARTLPASVTAALDTRASRRPAVAPAALLEPVAPPFGTPSANPSVAPSANPSAKDGGEGSGERETGVSPLALADKEVGSPPPAPVRSGARTRGRRPDVPEDDQRATATGSARQARQREAVRLVSVHCPAQPRRVEQALRGQVVELLREDIEPAVIAVGLRVWAGKQLPTSWVPELVGEVMRARTLPGDEAARRELATAGTVERMRADAIADDDRSPVGLAVRGELPVHADAAELRAVLDAALAATVTPGKDASTAGAGVAA
ncbi:MULTISPECIES: hypothetical protein [Actinosynnema]|uniref:hypothetical protein n=1 Tax=Actinosynnema TaxID=40566 RepID=UPI0020A37CBC|nr:hypothetical protein [Actinosynnema pretiosum]MCP2092683.1 hypothetical protein [Actinosynnema pretiosum]